MSLNHGWKADCDPSKNGYICIIYIKTNNQAVYYTAIYIYIYIVQTVASNRLSGDHLALPEYLNISEISMFVKPTGLVWLGY